MGLLKKISKRDSGGGGSQTPKEEPRLPALSPFDSHSPPLAPFSSLVVRLSWPQPSLTLTPASSSLLSVFLLHPLLDLSLTSFFLYTFLIPPPLSYCHPGKAVGDGLCYACLALMQVFSGLTGECLEPCRKPFPWLLITKWG